MCFVTILRTSIDTTESNWNMSDAVDNITIPLKFQGQFLSALQEEQYCMGGADTQPRWGAYLSHSYHGQHAVQLLLGQLAGRGAVGQGPDLSQGLPGQARGHQDGVELGCVNPSRSQSGF